MKIQSFVKKYYDTLLDAICEPEPVCSSSSSSVSVSVSSSSSSTSASTSSSGSYINWSASSIEQGRPRPIHTI